MKIIYRHLKPFVWPLWLSVIAMIAAALTELGLPFLLAEVINKGLYGNNSTLVLQLGGLMLFLAVISIVCTLLNGYFGAKIAAGVGLSLRNEVFKKVESFSLTETDRFGIASLITRSTNDVTQIQNYIYFAIRMVLRAPVMTLGGVVLAYLKSPTLSLVLLVSLPALFFMVTAIAKRGIPLSTVMQEKLDRVTLIMREKLTGVRVIRAFDNEGYEAQRFDKSSRDLTESAIKMHQTMALLFPVANIIMSLTILALVLLGGVNAASGNILVGDIMAMVQYVTQILISLMMISMTFVMLPRALSSVKRIEEVCDTQPGIVDTNAQVEETGMGFLSFEDVSFTYPGAEIAALSHINFTSSPGQTTAIVGSTGSGKSTLLKLIMRFYDVSDGRILVNGVDVRDYKQQALRQKLGYVPQRSVLFSGSIADNLRFGVSEATDEAIAEAAAIAQSEEFIGARDGGFDAEVSQGATNLSGGQKQRLSIARAIARNPEIYLFDDSFSALDFATDAKLRAALTKKTKDATVLIVAQRITTVINADQILVLEGGEQVGLGTHAELMESCTVYREITTSQLAAEECNE